MDNHFKTLFLEQAGAKTPKTRLWPLFHKALHRCRIIGQNGLVVDRSTFFWFNTNLRLRSLIEGTDAHYSIKSLNKPEFDALWYPKLRY